MSNRKIIITKEAETDIISIEKYIASDNKNAAKDFVIKLKKTFINLSQYPYLGKKHPTLSGDDKILFLPVMRNYLIVYTVIDDNVNIVRVLATYRNICAIL